MEVEQDKNSRTSEVSLGISEEQIIAEATQALKRKYVKNPRKEEAGKELKKRDTKTRTSDTKARTSTRKLDKKKIEEDSFLSTSTSQGDVVTQDISSTFFDDLIKFAAIIGAGFTIYNGAKFFSTEQPRGTSEVPLERTLETTSERTLERPIETNRGRTSKINNFFNEDVDF